MVLIISLLTLLFLFSVFTVSPPTQQFQNPFFAYYAHEISFITTRAIFFIIIYLILTFLFFRYNFDKKYSVIKIFIFSTIQTIFVAALGFFIAYVLLFFIAFVQLNMSATIINFSPKLLGVEDNENLVFKKLETTNLSPQILASDGDQKDVLRAIASATTGTTNFYGSVILPSIPNFFLFSTNALQANMLLIDNTVIITKMSPDEMQLISPLIGYRFVKNYFPTRAIKFYPKVAIMNRQEYDAYRKDDAKKKIVKIDGQIKKIDSIISSLSASMKNSPKDNTVPNQNILNEYKYYDDYFKKQEKVLLLQSEKISHENGVFQSPDVIKLTLDTTSPHGIADYFATVTHEYLHYASYQGAEKRFDSTFFEEGLTEYFARSAIKDALNTSTNLGYPVQVKIINQMTNLITPTEFADLYFQKDEAGLENALDRVYGDGFYQKNQVLFETLQYASDPGQTLGIANEIMKRIGGTPLTEDDLYSSYSKL